MGDLLSREEILAAKDMTHEDVPVPEWGKGKSVRIRTLTGEEKDAYDQYVFNLHLLEAERLGVEPKDLKQRVLTNTRAKLVSLCAIDDAGKRLFPKEADVILLGEKSAAALSRCSDVAQRLNRMRPQDFEDAVKDSGKGQSEGPSGE